MEEGAEIDVQESCKVCWTKRVVMRSGFLYCVECGVRSAESQPILDYNREDFKTSLSSKLVIKKKSATNNYSNLWSTWHAHNLILLGLVEELTMCGAKEALSGVVLRLWSRWLRFNKVAFFAKTQNRIPNLAMGFKPRDIKLLYGFDKKKKKVPNPSQSTSYHDSTMKAKKSLLALHKEEEKILNSQASSMPSASQNLEDLKHTEDLQTNEIQFSSALSKRLKKKMTPEEYLLHKKEGFCSSSCKCLKLPKSVFKSRLYQTSIFNLYVLLYLGVRINNDDIHAGDILRWCREGHLTFGNYYHFFPEDMTVKASDRYKLSSSMMTHKNILLVATRFARAFNLGGIKGPNIMDLIKRYIEELELPHELLGFISRIYMQIPAPIDFYSNEKFSLPNYEAIALSYIIVSLKMLFGLDGVSEAKISAGAKMCNKILHLDPHKKGNAKDYEQENLKNSYRRLFVFEDWSKYIEYRKICLSQCHYPTKMRIDPDNEDNPHLFLFHRNRTRRSQSAGIIKNNSLSIVKSLLQRIEDNYKHDTEYQFPLFSCSLTPMASNVDDLLTWQYLNSEYTNFQVNKQVLEQDFSLYNISFLIDPRILKDLLSKHDYGLYVHCYNANMDFSVIKNKLNKNIKLTDTLRVMSCKMDEWDSILKAEEMLIMEERDCDKLNDSFVSLDSRNHNAETRIKIRKPQTTKKGLHKHYVDVYTCFEHYWIKHYPNFLKKFTEQSFNKELASKFPPSFKWLLKECASVAEITTQTLYHQVCKMEKHIMKLDKKTKDS